MDIEECLFLVEELEINSVTPSQSATLDQSLSSPTLCDEHTLKWPHHQIKKKVLETIYDITSNFDRHDFAYLRSHYQVNDRPEEYIENVVAYSLGVESVTWDGGITISHRPATYPDIMVHSRGEPILAIEIKVWNMLAAEKSPTFRFATSPRACGPHDLLVLFPFVYDLGYPGSGPLRLYPPYIENSKYVAIRRNLYWTHNNPNAPIVEAPDDITPHVEMKRQRIKDHAANDSGKNFGRIARTPLLNRFCDQAWQYKHAPRGPYQFAPRSIEDWYRFIWGK